MVAVIKTGTSLHRSLDYNEAKVAQGKACCIGAENYPKDLAELTLSDKLNRLTRQAGLNENISRKSVHISLNFDASEKLSEPQLRQIARTYMEGIGFGEQPYLVYEHHDAAHPHIHIVTTKVRADGRGIDMYNIGRNQSEKTRKEIENDFGLVKARKEKQSPVRRQEPAGARKVRYGSDGVREAIGSVLAFVLESYRYTSLPELNAVLRQYNVWTGCGPEGAGARRSRRLVYQVLDERGNRVGVPIGAGAFPGKPTLGFLEARFAANRTARLPHKSRVRAAVDRFFLNRTPVDPEALEAALARQGIHVLARRNPDGTIYGITYVDHQTRCVFNGSALGGAYGARGISERCGQQAEAVPDKTLGRQSAWEDDGRAQPDRHSQGGADAHAADGMQAKGGPANSVAREVLAVLTRTEQAGNDAPGEPGGRMKRKKRKRASKQL